MLGNKRSTSPGAEEKAPTKTTRNRRDPSASRDERRRLSAVAGALAGVAVVSLGIGIWQVNSASQLKSELYDGTVSVCVAAKDVAAGSEITSADITVAQVPEKYVPANHTSDAADLVGHTALVSLTADVPVATDAVQGSEQATTLAAALDDGYVGYTVTVSTANGMSPLLAVGDHVNVLVGSSESDAQVLAEDVTVVALDGVLAGTTSSYSTVTLEVTDDLATQLYQATDLDGGTVHLTLSPKSASPAQGATVPDASTDESE